MKSYSRFLLLLLLIGVNVSAYADEGMWLLQIMQEQHSIDMMKKAGLRLKASDIYNPNGISLKDAVGIFGEGCTGEIISGEGLILTNHHCGYESIQALSSVDHDYLTNGFWSKNRKEELPVNGLQFRFVDKIIDVTDRVNADIRAQKVSESESISGSYCEGLATEYKARSKYKGKKYIEAEVLPFYAGNSFYLIYYKVYKDVRMVAAPPSAIGKFGGETDNWMWPRHTGDFSMFRIYADKKGEPAEYSEKNVPLKTKKHLAISLKGINEGDYTMIMGFPGSTSRYLTASEVKDCMETDNMPRIKVRSVVLDELKKAMSTNDTIRIQYADIFASSSNYWKNSIGMNKAIIDNNVIETKKQQEKAFEDFAKDKPEYQGVIAGIDKAIQASKKFRYATNTFFEMYRGSQFNMITTTLHDLPAVKKDIAEKDIKTLKKDIIDFAKDYDYIHNKDYDGRVEKKVMKATLPLYAQMVPANQRPDYFKTIESKYHGNFDKYVDDLFDSSIFGNRKAFEAFVNNPTEKALDDDMGLQYATSILHFSTEFLNNEANNKYAIVLDSLHKKYIRGLCEIKLPSPSYPDANFTIRLTYGNVKSYNPKDGVMYRYYTTTDGILEKENPKDPEFVVPTKLKELIQNKDFGRYAMPNGEMPVAFLTTNDITGGNSGSPVLNSKGQLIGAAFDGNWESLSGDINFDNKLQRCICVDIRYILFVLDKLGGCSNLINEMTIE
ncbi:MAG: S46 family peptidase [Bacteroidales bacterium]|nr:S46 family peptidase [Bacteroidales bacterium]